MKDKDGKTALMYATENAREDCVEILARYEIGQVDKSNLSALCYACKGGYDGCV